MDLSTEVLNDNSPDVLAAAIKNNLYSFFYTIGDSAHARFWEGPAGFRWWTSVPHPWFSGFLGSQDPGAGAGKLVEEVVDYFRSQGSTGFTWWLAPGVDTALWRQVLQPRGFDYEDSTPGMAIPLANLPAPGDSPLEIRLVEDSQTLAEWARTFVVGYDMPASLTGVFLQLMESVGTGLSLRHYLGFLNGQPVATSSLYIGAGVAGLYNVATLPSFRRRGFGLTLTLVPLYEAQRMGYRIGILQSSDMGYPVYRRLGFSTYCQMDHFYCQPAA